MLRRSSMPALLLVAVLVISGCGGDGDGGGVDIGTVEATATGTAGGERTPTAAAATPTAGRATPSATATSTATLAASPCPIAPDACSFMSQAAQHVVEGDSAAVVSLSKSKPFTCPGPNGGPGGPFPLCNGAPTGEIRLGFPIRRIGGEPGAVVEADIVRLVAEWTARTEPSLSDEFGDGGARAYSVACPKTGPEESRGCGEQFSLIFSGLSPGASAGEVLRTVLVVDVRREQGEYRAVGFATGVLAGGVELALRGGSGTAGSDAVPSALVGGAAEGERVTFFPWAPIGLQR
ncbi:MAG: hypothetical protein AB7L91_04345 [Dehalococcoidia bacterium]